MEQVLLEEVQEQAEVWEAEEAGAEWVAIVPEQDRGAVVCVQAAERK